MPNRTELIASMNPITATVWSLYSGDAENWHISGLTGKDAKLLQDFARDHYPEVLKLDGVDWDLIAQALDVEGTVFDYFTEHMGVAPSDESFKELPTYSNVGQDCARAIDAAKLLAKHEWTATGGMRKTRELVETICRIYWHG